MDLREDRKFQQLFAVREFALNCILPDGYHFSDALDTAIALSGSGTDLYAALSAEHPDKSPADIKAAILAEFALGDSFLVDYEATDLPVLIDTLSADIRALKIRYPWVYRDEVEAAYMSVHGRDHPIVLAHGRALLATNATTTVITADMRQPETILDHPDLRALIDFTRPVAVLFVAVFHFITDADNPAGILAALRDRMAPGSYLALSHLTTDGPPAQEVGQVVDMYKDATSPIVFRPHHAITEFFDGFELVKPGIVRPWQWRPDLGPIGPKTDWLYAGVARHSSQ
jgi:hypothetical protein